MRTSALLMKKTSFFLEIYVHTDKERELSQCGHFTDKGEGSIFRNFVRTSFVDGPYLVVLL